MRISIMSSRELFISSPRCTCAGATVRDATFDVITSNLMFSEIFLIVGCLRYKFDVDNDLHIAGNSFLIFYHFSKVVCKFTDCFKLS